MLKKRTKEIQTQFASYCRHKSDELPDGVNELRINKYRSLCDNIIDDTLSQTYPIAKFLLDENQWNTIMDSFIKSHPFSNPQLWKMPKELILFLEDPKQSELLFKPYLIDLLIFEWKEVEIHTMKDVKITFDASKELIDQLLVFNPYLEILHLNYAVHDIKKETGTVEKKATKLIVYRDNNDNVQYKEINLLTAHLISSLQEQNVSLKKMIESDDSIQENQMGQVIEQSVNLLKHLKDEGIILGVKKPQ
jgi:hypothetical protein